MFSIKTILFPTDFSDSALVALPHVREMAQRFGAKVHVLHVLETILQPADFSWSAAYPDLDRKRKESAKRRLEEVAKELDLDEGRVEAVLAAGHPAAEIDRYAEEHDVNLIIMSTHGHTGLSHFLLGSVAEKVVRKAPCPVMTVKGVPVEDEPA